jgi:hypothetical protein
MLLAFLGFRSGANDLAEGNVELVDPVADYPSCPVAVIPNDPKDESGSRHDLPRLG